MNFPRYKPGPVDYWLTEAATEFINGFFDGYGGGAASGVGTGVITGTTSLGHDMNGMEQVFIAVAATLTAMLGNAMQAVYIWHKIHRFPNPWPQPTGTTTPPFPPALP